MARPLTLQVAALARTSKSVWFSLQRHQQWHISLFSFIRSGPYRFLQGWQDSLYGCFLGIKTRTLSGCLAMTVFLSARVTGQCISKQASGGSSVPDFLHCWGCSCCLGPCLVPFPQGTHFLAAPWHSPQSPMPVLGLYWCSHLLPG